MLDFLLGFLHFNIEVSIKASYSNNLPYFKSYNVAKNVQVDPKTPIDERLKAIKQILGEEFYKKFEEANKEDIIFWNMVLEMYEVSKK